MPHLPIRKDIYQEIGRRIKSQRGKLGFTQEYIASQLGLERTSIINIEKGKQRVSFDHLYNIARTLGVGAKDLLPQSVTVSKLNTIDINEPEPYPADRISKTTYDSLRRIIEETTPGACINTTCKHYSPGRHNRCKKIPYNTPVTICECSGDVD